MNPISNHEVAGVTPGLARQVKDLGLAVSCDVGCRRGSDLEWLWRRPAAVAPIRTLPWEPPYAAGVALKEKERERPMSRIRRLHEGWKWKFHDAFFFCPFAFLGPHLRHTEVLAVGQIGAVAAGLHQSHSNAGSEPHL